MSRQRYTYKAHHVGRLRIAAAKILSIGELIVRPEDIKPATGSWRTDWRSDVYRWELFAQTKTGLPVVAGCWFTLTEFVKHARKSGFHIHDGEINPGPTK